MEAMVFAAGLGTRLKPLTDRTPKALVDVGGVAMLERVARRLAAAGCRRMVVNVHGPTFADRIERFVLERAGFGMEVAFSREDPVPLETGGGLRHARGLLLGDGPLLLHNADVLTDLPLEAMVEAHVKERPLVTLAVMERPTQRYLLFDEHGLLGRVDETRDLDLRVREPAGEVTKLGFAGVHVVSRELLEQLTEEGVFSILEPYLRLAREGASILPFRVDGCRWVDIGRPEQLEAARRLVQEGVLA
jgi:NDP-sugar pyrophosphorylase family protein